MSGRLSSQVIAGREGELADVRAAYERAAGGSASAVLIGGEAGVGKTRLLTELTSVALGQTNREIAADLFISARTAGVHVSHILEKLGASTRTEAATAAHRLELVS